MASNNFTSFTITQAFLGAPLQFTPALGSQELDQLIDAYVPGTAARSDKLSDVTIDFYNHATVDLNTGSLVRRYDVLLTQSPTQSQSSGFSPTMYTPSPASSGYGSISMTPPASRNRAGRVSKPAKKDTKKVAEARLPGFSIMTKDGIDVTSSAGRGTKTKEQREHAHLMRIMKACDDCKRKKVRCDPSHRRQNHEMSRTSTASTAKTSSSSRTNPSPPAAPSLPQTPFASQSTTSSGSFSNAIDDFVLFPEDASASWNPADLSLPEDADLSNFNFDINDINLDIPMNSADFDFSAFDNMPPMDFNQLYEPSVPQYNMDQWVNLPISHSRPHPSASSQDSGQFDMTLQDSWVQALPDSGSYRPQPSTSSQELGHQNSFFSTANVSPQSIGSLADEIWPDGNSREESQFYGRGRVQQPFSERSGLERTTQQQSLSENSLLDGMPSSPFFGLQQSQGESSPTDTSQYSPADSSGSGSNASSRTSLQTDDPQYWTESTDKTKRGRESPAATLARRQLSSSGGSTSSSGGQENLIDASARPDGQAERVRELQHPEANAYQPSLGDPRGHDRPRPSRSSLGVSNDIFGLANTCTLVSESLRAVKQGPAECLSLAGDLQRLRTVLAQSHSEAVNAGTSTSATAEVVGDTASQIDTFGRQLQGLSASIRRSQVQNAPLPQGVLRQSRVQAQLLLRSLCATINSLHTSRTESFSARPSNYQPLTSGRNLQLFVPASEGHDRDRHTQSLPGTGVEAMYDGHLIAQDSRSTPPRPDYFATRLQEDEGRYSLAFNKDAYEGAFAPGVGSVVPAWEIHDSPWNPVLAKQVLSSLQGWTEPQQEDRRQVVASDVRLDSSILGEVASPALEPASDYHKVIILATLASAVIATITRTASMLALFIPLSALLLSSPRQFQVAAPSCLAIMALLGTGYIQTFQGSCQVWRSNSFLVSMSRFALCAAIVAQPLSFLACAKAVATLFSLLGSNSDCCGTSMFADSVNSRRNSPETLRPTLTNESRRPQWLGMMNRLTAVAV